MRNKPNKSSYDDRVAAVHPKGSSATPKSWDTSYGTLCEHQGDDFNTFDFEEI
jgi:hypothetical protein